MTIDDIKKIDMVQYLKKCGMSPKRNSGKYAFYLSPFREETKPSFAICKNTNKWKDHGANEWGSIIDFVMKYENMSLPQALTFLGNGDNSDIPEYVPTPNKDAIKIDNIRTPSNKEILSVLCDIRRIDYDLIIKYCKEFDVSFPMGKNPDAIYPVIGMQNDAGGFDFRGKDSWLKMSSAPKTITTVKGDKSKYCVYEGFTSFLSHLTVLGVKEPVYKSYLLNGLGQLDVLMPFIGNTPTLLYLDNDKAADNKMKEITGDNFIDMRYEYSFFNDWGDYLKCL